MSHNTATHIDPTSATFPKVAEEMHFFPTPQVSPATTVEKKHEAAEAATLAARRQYHQLVVKKFNASSPTPMSPTCSVATQTAELLADWTDDSESTVSSTRKAGLGLGSPILAAPPVGGVLATSSVGTGTSTIADDILEGTIAVIMTLVMKGDVHWESANPRRCKSVSAKTNVQHTVTGVIRALRADGLLKDEVAIALVVYLRRLSAKHVKYVSRFTIKKYLVAACLVANKTCSDTYYTLDTYTESTGIPKAAIVEAEVQFLVNMDYDVQMGLVHDHRQSHGLMASQEESANEMPHPAAITFFQTSVLIHDMATAAAAIVSNNNVEQGPAAVITEDADATVTTSAMATLAATTAAEPAAATCPESSCANAVNTSIVSIVEGILASAEACI